MSARPEFKGDYMGFSFGYKADGTPMHSSDLGIVRTSNGSRFDENLLPTMQDKTVQVPGGDGTYYFGSYYTQRPFSVSFAFDSLTEQQVAMLKSHFGDKKIHDLVFDEKPYKVYRAKVTGSATMKYIPFAEGDINRLYKGEGTIQFTCYNPFAYCNKKWLEDYDNCENIIEWKDASGLKQSRGKYDERNAREIKVYNPGDMESDFTFKIKFVDKKIPAGSIWLTSDKKISWDTILQEGNDSYIKINTKLNLIEGFQTQELDGKIKHIKTGNVYNKYINSGEFFKIPQGDRVITISDIASDNALSNYIESFPIEYNYYYF